MPALLLADLSSGSQRSGGSTYATSARSNVSNAVLNLAYHHIVAFRFRHVRYGYHQLVSRIDTADDDSLS
jgi:hypothetical protein